MITNEDYQKITKDIAGSRTKNRFSYEMTYGICSIYKLYKKKAKDFFVIFDYACDIEEGENDKISFYQLKTTSEPFTLSKLLYAKKNGKSILQTLIDLKNNDSVNKINLVSNLELKGLEEDEKHHFHNLETFSFDQLLENDKNKINEKIVWPNGISDFKSLFFIRSNICLKKPSDSLLAETLNFLNDLFPNTPNRADVFQDSILAKVQECANNENDTVTLQETINSKGMIEESVNKLLCEYNSILFNSKFINSEKIGEMCKNLNLSIGLNIDVKQAYIEVAGKGYIPEVYQLEMDMIKKQFKTSDYYNLSIEDAIKKIVNEHNFKNEYDDAMKYCLAICSFEQQ